MSDSMPDDAPTIAPDSVPEAAVVPGDSAETPGRVELGPEETLERVELAPEETVEGVELGPEETVEGVPVLAEARPIAPAAPAALPAVQAVAVAATGFVAGAATIALVKRHSARKMARATRSGPRRAVDMLPIVGSRTFLVDVHLIAKPQE